MGLREWGRVGGRVCRVRVRGGRGDKGKKWEVGGGRWEVGGRGCRCEEGVVSGRWEDGV